jgi:hypothetical protein
MIQANLLLQVKADQVDGWSRFWASQHTFYIPQVSTDGVRRMVQTYGARMKTKA